MPKHNQIILPRILESGLCADAWLDQHYYPDGCNLSTAANKLGLDPTKGKGKRTLWQWLKNNGYRTKGQSECQTGKLNGFHQKKHAPDSKKLIGAASSSRNTGKGNPAYKDVGHLHSVFLRKRTFANLTHYPCTRCQKSTNLHTLHIHHRDHNRRNNELSNLDIWCRRCHWDWHTLEGAEKDMAKRTQRLIRLREEWVNPQIKS
jgi:hypothetical protein